jgi:hypothetical protein
MKTGAVGCAAGFGRRMLVGAVAVACLGVGAGCGGGGESVGPSPLPTTRVVVEGAFRLAAPVDDGVFFTTIPVTDSATGNWRATVDWTHGSNTLWVWVANGTCAVEQFAAPECPFESSCACQFLVRSETGTPKPRVLTVANAAGGTRTLIIANLGPEEESGSYQITLQSAAALAGGDSEPWSPAGGTPLPPRTGTKRVTRR